MLREEKYSVWCCLLSFMQKIQTIIIEKRGLTTSDWINTLQMVYNLIPIKSNHCMAVLSITVLFVDCIHCENREFLSHNIYKVFFQ